MKGEDPLSGADVAAAFAKIEMFPGRAREIVERLRHGHDDNNVATAALVVMLVLSDEQWATVERSGRSRDVLLELLGDEAHVAARLAEIVSEPDVLDALRGKSFLTTPEVVALRAALVAEAPRWAAATMAALDA